MNAFTNELDEYLWQAKANDNFRSDFSRELFYNFKPKEIER